MRTEGDAVAEEDDDGEGLHGAEGPLDEGDGGHHADDGPAWGRIRPIELFSTFTISNLVYMFERFMCNRF